MDDSIRCLNHDCEQKNGCARYIVRPAIGFAHAMFMPDECGEITNTNTKEEK